MYVDRFIGNWAFKVRLFSSNNLIFSSRLFYLLIINQHFIGFFCLNWKSWKSTSFSNSFLRPVPSSVFLVQYSSFSIPSSVFLYSVFLVQYSQFSIPLSVFPVQYSQFSICEGPIIFKVFMSRSQKFDVSKYHFLQLKKREIILLCLLFCPSWQTVFKYRIFVAVWNNQ